jgi:membrane associated rhomboid family serine protease
MSSEFSRNLRSLADRCAIPGLIRYVALFNALVFVLHLLAPGYLSVLELDPRLVLRGEIWRLVTWIFIPETLSPFWIFFALLFLLYLGDGLEAAMGSTKLTLFYASGVILCTLVNFLFGLQGGGAALGRANTFLNLSLMLAFATLYPDFKVLVFFILPVRMVSLAIFSTVIMVMATLGQPLVVAATLGASLLNYLLFFRRELTDRLGIINKLPKAPRIPVIAAKRSASSVETLHHCETCARTEASDPNLEFRVAANGHEYCREHLPGKGTLG